MKTLFSLALAASLFSGCSVFTASQTNYFNSSMVSKNNRMDYTIIVEDMYKFVSTYYAPNKTILYMSTNDSSKTLFNYLVQKFRDRGYAVTSDNTLRNLTFLSYNIRNDNNMIVVTYNIDESRINRIYLVENDQLVRAGGITSFNFARSPLPFEEMPRLAKVEEKDFIAPKLEDKLENDSSPVNTFTEETIKPMVKPVSKPEFKEKPKTAEKPIIASAAPKKEKIKPLTLKVQAPFKSTIKNTDNVPQTAQKSTKVPLAIGEDGKPVETPKIEAYKDKVNSKNDLEVSTIIEQLENNTTIPPKELGLGIKETLSDFNQVGDTQLMSQEPQKETKAPMVMVEEVKPVETPKIETPTIDKNTSTDLKVIAAIEQLKIEPTITKDDNKTLKSETKIDSNSSKVINNDMKDTNLTIETVVIPDRPFDMNDTTPNSTVTKELTLVETIEEAVAVYPNFDEKKLREDLMRLVVKSPWIDAESVKTMPLNKGLLLQLLKVAKEKQ